MKYVYDILLNFNEEKIYEFYEWNNDDDIEYFKKLPLFRINDELYRNIVINSIIEDNILLEKIYNATEIYDHKLVRRVEYACVFTTGKEAQGVLLNKVGKIIMISRMLIDEEEEAIEIGNTLKELPLLITCTKQTVDMIPQYLTRYEKRKMYFLNKEIEELYLNKKIIKLKYLYYECSHHIEEDIDIIYEKIKLFLNEEWEATHDELYNLVRLSYSKK